MRTDLPQWQFRPPFLVAGCLTYRFLGAETSSLPGQVLSGWVFDLSTFRSRNLIAHGVQFDLSQSFESPRLLPHMYLAFLMYNTQNYTQDYQGYGRGGGKRMGKGMKSGPVDDGAASR